MVMVLLFLGVIFLLLGLRAVSSSSSSDDYTSPPASATGTSATGTPASATGTSGTSGKPAPNQAEIHVYNITDKDGVARRIADQLKAAGFKVAEPSNLTPSPADVTTTTVYYGDAEGDKATADAVGQKLGAPVERRTPALADQPPGVVVLAAG
jgi:hypothetical protein